MNPQVLAGLMVLSALVLIVIGCPVFLAIGISAVLFGFLGEGTAMFGMFSSRTYSLMTSFPFQAVVLFVLMGCIMERSGLASRLYSGLYVITGFLKGGLLVATLILGILFAACTGIAGASVVAIGLIALPSMLERGYNKSLAAGSICAGGGLGVIIPPSIMLVLYGPPAGLSVADLFMAAIFPGLLLGVIFIVYVLIVCYRNPALAPPVPEAERKIGARALAGRIATSVIPTLFLILFVMGSIIFGIASPTEAASLGAIGALAILAGYRQFTWKNIRDSAEATLRTSAMVIIIALSANLFTTVFFMLEGGLLLENFVYGLNLGNLGVVCLLLGMILLLGCFMDWIAILLIFVPLSVPIVIGYGIDPLWFAILACITLQMSYITPPFSYSVFYLKGIAPKEVTLGDIYKGVLPYIPFQVLVLVLLYLFPQISLWLPSVMH
jgi:tripartite ATP-independent transporter DctM subunit